MEYSFKFIVIYLVLQLILTLAAYFYYNSYIKKMYLKNNKLPYITGFSQFIVFLSHGIVLYIPYYLYEPWSFKGFVNTHCIIGIILGSFSLIIVIGGFINLGIFSKTMGIEPGRLRTKGLYRISRNPQLTGYCLLLISCAFIWPSWYIILSIISFVIIGHRMVLTEEIHLRNVFGKDYEKYLNSTRRYL